MRGKNRVNERETCFIQLRAFNFHKKIPSYHNCLSVLSVPAAFCTAFLQHNATATAKRMLFFARSFTRDHELP